MQASAGMREQTGVGHVEHFIQNLQSQDTYADDTTLLVRALCCRYCHRIS